MVVLGGIGTLWGPAVGAALVVQLEDYLATAGFVGVDMVIGAVFVVVVLLFRRGIWGTVAHWSHRFALRRRASGHCPRRPKGRRAWIAKAWTRRRKATERGNRAGSDRAHGTGHRCGERHRPGHRATAGRRRVPRSWWPTSTPTA